VPGKSGKPAKRSTDNELSGVSDDLRSVPTFKVAGQNVASLGFGGEGGDAVHIVTIHLNQTRLFPDQFHGMYDEAQGIFFRDMKLFRRGRRNFCFRKAHFRWKIHSIVSFPTSIGHPEQVLGRAEKIFDEKTKFSIAPKRS